MFMSEVLKMYGQYMSQKSMDISATEMAKAIVFIARKHGFDALKVQQSLRMQVLRQVGCNSKLTLRRV